ncbi:uncharacterized protein VP01_424g1 [Puccinia sorghi]|uniref:Uncharacterized protein n=1 Tax=Puccinia sorghi TaxID=27349 RepID=A0A0L6UQF5_9BASI|nr:uncharacterized protein VP01_424g1 [Puccinia sorghi]
MGQKNYKKKDDTSSSNDNVAVVPCATCPSATKKFKRSKYNIFKSEVESLVGAIQETGSNRKEDKKKTASVSKGKDPFASIFLSKVTTLKYVKFIKVVESKKNAKVFLSLASTNNGFVCQAWLEESSAHLG